MRRAGSLGSFLILSGVALVASLLTTAALAEPSPIPEDCFPPSQTFWLDEGPTDPGLTMGSTGEVRGAVIFVDFSDAPQSETTTSYFDRFGPTTTSTFDDLSYGRFDLALTPIHKWYRMSKPSPDYGFDRFNFTFQKHRAFMAEALALADPDIDLSEFDFFVVAASKRAAVDGTAFIAPNPGDELMADGKAFRFAATVEERHRDLLLVPGFGSPVTIHELTHLLGLPDLYNNADPYFDDAGTWDYMAQPEPVVPGLFGWHKWKLGWLEDDQVRCQVGAGSIEETLTPVSVAGGTKLIVVRTGETQAYAIEARRAVGTDSRLCEEGVLIYSIDTSRISGSDPSAVLVKPAQADDPNQRERCGWLYEAPFDVGENEVSTFESVFPEIKVEVSASSDAGYDVRVTYGGGYTPPTVSHSRSVDLTIKKHMVVSGVLVGTDEFSPCVAGVDIELQRRASPGWKPVQSVETTSTGSFTMKLPDKPGKYRAVAKAHSISTVHGCREAVSAIAKHNH